MKKKLVLSLMVIAGVAQAGDFYFQEKYEKALSNNNKLELQHGDRCRTEAKGSKMSKFAFEYCMSASQTSQMSLERQIAESDAIFENRYIRDSELSVLKEYARRERLPNVTIGMTESGVIEKSRWGMPDRITTIKNATGIISKFFYGKNSLTFVNGILTEIQTSS